jgi:hypothetical protein
MKWRPKDMTLIEYRPIRYGNTQKPTVKDMQESIMTTKNRVVTTEAAREVINTLSEALESSERRVRELQIVIDGMKEQALISKARGSKLGVAK